MEIVAKFFGFLKNEKNETENDFTYTTEYDSDIDFVIVGNVNATRIESNYSDVDGEETHLEKEDVEGKNCLDSDDYAGCVRIDDENMRSEESDNHGENYEKNENDSGDNDDNDEYVDQEVHSKENLIIDESYIDDDEQDEEYDEDEDDDDDDEQENCEENEDVPEPFIYEENKYAAMSAADYKAKFALFQKQLYKTTRDMTEAKLEAGPELRSVQNSKTLRLADYNDGNHFLLEIYTRLQRGEKVYTFKCINLEKRYGKVSAREENLLFYALTENEKPQNCLLIEFDDMKACATDDNFFIFLYLPTDEERTQMIPRALFNLQQSAALFKLCSGECDLTVSGRSRTCDTSEKKERKRKDCGIMFKSFK